MSDTFFQKPILLFGLLLAVAGALLTGCNGPDGTTQNPIAQIAGTIPLKEGYFLERTGVLRYPRTDSGGIALKDGRVMVCGPVKDDHKLTMCEIYNAETGKFTNGGLLLVRKHLKNTAYIMLPDGKILVAGGYAGKNLPDQCDNNSEIYEPETNQFVLGTKMLNTCPHNLTGVPVESDKLLFISESPAFDTKGEKFPAIAELYDIATKTFTEAGKPIFTGPNMTATRLSSGKVLVTGTNGEKDANIQSRTQIYNPKTNAFIQGPVMSQPRYASRAMLLPDGKVLFAGGRPSPLDTNMPSRIASRSSELYNPVTNRFAPGPQMYHDRIYPHLLLLPNKKVLVIGGDDPGAPSTAEIYDPVLNKFSDLGELPASRIGTAHGVMQEVFLLPNNKVLVLRDRTEPEFLPEQDSEQMGELLLNIPDLPQP